MKKSFTLLLFLILPFQLFSQAISPYLFGQNAWYIGTGYNLDGLWSTVKGSNVRMVRIGGTAADFERISNAQYVALIDSIRKIGAEPLVQVPYGGGRYTATDAANLVDYINIVSKRNVQYWAISNEPNISPANASAATVAAYTKSFASAMKAKDPTIKISALACAWYDPNYYTPLIGGAGDLDITGKDASGRYYVDIVSFHAYFSNLQRDTIINWPTATYTSSNPEIGNGFSYNVNDLKARLANADAKWGRTGTQRLQWAITEFHLVNNHLIGGVNSVEGNGTHSFLAGQHWCQMFGVGMQKGAFLMAPWSVYESSGNRSNQDLGYLDGANKIPRSTYYHEMMMSDNMKGNYITSTSSQRTVKVIASKSATQIGIVLLNMNATSDFNYALRLDNALSTSANPLKFRVNAGVVSEQTGLIKAQSTMVLVFDLQGKLVKRLEYALADAQQNRAPRNTTPQTPVRTPYFGIPAAMPGRIEAENFDKGGQGITFSDTETSNFGGKYRVTEGVDIENTVDATGIYNIGWIRANEWLEYTFSVPATARYGFTVRLASPLAAKRFHLEIDGVNVSGSIGVPVTGSYQNWADVGVPAVTIAAGTHVLRFYAETDGFNFNWIDMYTTGAARLGEKVSVISETLEVFPNPSATEINVRTMFKQTGDVQLRIISLQGQIIREWVERATSEVFLKTMNVSNLKPGFYILEIRQNGEYRVAKWYKQ